MDSKNTKRIGNGNGSLVTGNSKVHAPARPQRPTAAVSLKPVNNSYGVLAEEDDREFTQVGARGQMHSSSKPAPSRFVHPGVLLQENTKLQATIREMEKALSYAQSQNAALEHQLNTMSRTNDTLLRDLEASRTENAALEAQMKPKTLQWLEHAAACADFVETPKLPTAVPVRASASNGPRFAKAQPHQQQHGKFPLKQQESSNGSYKKSVGNNVSQESTRANGRGEGNGKHCPHEKIVKNQAGQVTHHTRYCMQEACSFEHEYPTCQCPHQLGGKVCTYGPHNIYNRGGGFKFYYDRNGDLCWIANRGTKGNGRGQITRKDPACYCSTDRIVNGRTEKIPNRHTGDWTITANGVGAELQKCMDARRKFPCPVESFCDKNKIVFVGETADEELDADEHQQFSLGRCTDPQCVFTHTKKRALNWCSAGTMCYNYDENHRAEYAHFDSSAEYWSVENTMSKTCATHLSDKAGRFCCKFWDPKHRQEFNHATVQGEVICAFGHYCKDYYHDVTSPLNTCSLVHPPKDGTHAGVPQMLVGGKYVILGDSEADSPEALADEMTGFVLNRREILARSIHWMKLYVSTQDFRKFFSDFEAAKKYALSDLAQYEASVDYAHSKSLQQYYIALAEMKDVMDAEDSKDDENTVEEVNSAEPSRAPSDAENDVTAEETEDFLFAQQSSKTPSTQNDQDHTGEVDVEQEDDQA
jgi:hypothetical protein